MDWGELLSEAGSKRAVTRIMKAVFLALGDYWHQEILPRHFEPGAHDRYGYAERTTAHARRKARLWGATPQYAAERSLVFTGRMKSQLQRWVEVKAYPSRFTVLMHGPRYVGMRPMRSNMPNMGEEITAVTVAELNELADYANRILPDIVATETTRKRRSR